MGHLDEVGMYFLVFILAWIPVHILTLALLPNNLDGYNEIKVPLWPVVSSKSQAMRVIALGAVVSSMTLYRIAHLLEASAIIRIILFICDLIFLILVIKNLIRPSNRLTFLIFKIASLYMILGFLVLYLGVVF